MSKLRLYLHYDDESVAALVLSKHAASNAGSLLEAAVETNGVSGVALVCSLGTIIQELGKAPEYGWLQTVATHHLERGNT